MVLIGQALSLAYAYNWSGLNYNCAFADKGLANHGIRSLQYSDLNSGFAIPDYSESGFMLLVLYPDPIHKNFVNNK